MPEGSGAAIYSLGTELTEGIIRDSHGHFLASLLTSRGIRVEKLSQLRDTIENADEVKRDAARRRLLLFTGGLGPTSDDITRELIAEASGKALEFRRDLWQHINRRYGLSGAEANTRQAYLPQGFTALSNEWGTAPGFWGEVDGTLYIALPGPPGELKAMCDRYLDELLGERFELQVKEFTAATSFLVPESVLEDACRRHAQSGILWRTRVEPFRIHLHLDGGNERQREAFLEGLRGDLGSELLRSGEQEPAALFLEAAAGRGARVAVAESCTGGMVGERITAVPGSSEVFWGSAVVYADEAKRSMLGVSPETLETYGAVSRETAEEMVRGLLERSGVELAGSVTGIAGPGGGSAAKPVGTVWIATGSKDGGITAYRFAFGQRRELVRRRSVTAALLMMEMELKGELRVDRLEAWHYS